VKRPSYRVGIEWIALNDDDGSAHALSISEVSGMISVALLADLFGKRAIEVAVDVVSFRIKNQKVRK
jgi:hypothetical protein